MPLPSLGVVHGQCTGQIESSHADVIRDWATGIHADRGEHAGSGNPSWIETPTVMKTRCTRTVVCLERRTRSGHRTVVEAVRPHHVDRSTSCPS